MSWKEHPDLPNIIKMCPPNRFSRIDNIYKFINYEEVRCPFLVAFVTNHIQEDKFSLNKEVVSIPLININIINSFSLPCGWIFEIPNYEIDVEDVFIKIYKPEAYKADFFPNPKQVYVTSHFSIFSAEDKAVLVLDHRHKILTASDL